MTPKTPVQTLDKLQERLNTIHDTHGLSWRAIAQIPEFAGIPAGTLCAIAKGRDPKDAHERLLLRLPALAPAPVCPKCGVPHVTKRCTAGRKPRQLADPTELERKALYLVRVNELPEPEREYRFARAMGREWRFDLAWPALKLAVEVEGGIYGRGRHTRGKGYEDDCTKYSWAALLGWRVLRFGPKMLEDGRSDQLLRAAFGIEVKA
jgi:very-short-patch-repair endonuclease